MDTPGRKNKSGKFSDITHSAAILNINPSGLWDDSGYLWHGSCP